MLKALNPAEPSTPGLTSARPHSAKTVLGVLSSIAVIIAWGTVLVLIAVLSPKYAEIFRDFGLPLSTLSRFFISFANMLHHPLGIGLSVAFMLGVFSAVTWASTRSRLAWLLLFLLLLAGAAIVFLLFFISMLIPTQDLIDAVQRTPV